MGTLSDESLRLKRCPEHSFEIENGEETAIVFIDNGQFFFIKTFFIVFTILFNAF